MSRHDEDRNVFHDAFVFFSFFGLLLFYQDVSPRSKSLLQDRHTSRWLAITVFESPLHLWAMEDSEFPCLLPEIRYIMRNMSCYVGAILIGLNGLDLHSSFSDLGTSIHASHSPINTMRVMNGSKVSCSRILIRLKRLARSELVIAPATFLWWDNQGWNSSEMWVCNRSCVIILMTVC